MATVGEKLQEQLSALQSLEGMAQTWGEMVAELGRAVRKAKPPDLDPPAPGQFEYGRIEGYHADATQLLETLGLYIMQIGEAAHESQPAVKNRLAEHLGVSEEAVT